MSESENPSSHDTFCPYCPPGRKSRPVVILERFGIKRFFCSECERVWDDSRTQTPSLDT